MFRRSFGIEMRMGKRVAIVQSNYIPWRGYFDLIRSCDEFILLDEVQYTRRDWRNRNRLKSASGTIWLTIPVESKGKYHQKISETMIGDPQWNQKHWKTIEHCYRRARYFSSVGEQILRLYENAIDPHLSHINAFFLKGICGMLGISTKLSWSTEYPSAEGKTERLVELCRACGATEYLSGPRARDYINPSAFEEAGVTLQYMSYEGYPEYDQMHPPFDPHVSILDVLFNTGEDARRMLDRVSVTVTRPSACVSWFRGDEAGQE